MNPMNPPKNSQDLNTTSSGPEGYTERFETGKDLGLSRMREAFARAMHQSSGLSYEFRIVLAGRQTHFRLLGQRLRTCMEVPFRHLQVGATPSVPPALTIDIWDAAECGIDCKLGSDRNDLDQHPILKKSDDGRFFSYQLQHSLICLDRTDNAMVGKVSSAEALSLYQLGRPLHVPLSLWHKSQGIPLIHAGLVSKDRRGAIMVGAGGSGKSTCAITCALAGFNYLSDDLVGLEITGDSNYIGHSLYNSTYLEPDHLERFPSLKVRALPCKYPYEKKPLVLLSQVPTIEFMSACRIHAILLPRVTANPTSSFREVSRGEALLALAPTSLLVGDRSSGREGFEKLASLVEGAPCYRLEIGTRLSDIPRAVANVLATSQP